MPLYHPNQHSEGVTEHPRKPRSGAQWLPNDACEIDIRKVIDILPHRFPMLMIDRVEDYKPGEYLLLRKCVTYNEPYFPGHFPNHPLMPGVLILEAMAQGASLTAVVDIPNVSVEGVTLASIDKAKFHRPVYPGDVLLIKCSHERSLGMYHKFDCRVFVDGNMVARARVMALNSPNLA